MSPTSKKGKSDASEAKEASAHTDAPRKKSVKSTAVKKNTSPKKPSEPSKPTATKKPKKKLSSAKPKSPTVDLRLDTRDLSEVVTVQETTPRVDSASMDVQAISPKQPTVDEQTNATPSIEDTSSEPLNQDPDTSKPADSDDDQGAAMDTILEPSELPTPQDPAIDENLDPEQLLSELEKNQLLWRWASIELTVVSPVLQAALPPKKIDPSMIQNTPTPEHVYPIYDAGNAWSTSKAEEMHDAGMSMCKLYFTIEKMVCLLVERLKAENVSLEQEVQVDLFGFELAKRKTFESLINLSYNVVINNYNPSEWGDAYLARVPIWNEKGLGYPAPAPREDVYNHLYNAMNNQQSDGG